MEEPKITASSIESVLRKNTIQGFFHTGPIPYEEDCTCIKKESIYPDRLTERAHKAATIGSSFFDPNVFSGSFLEEYLSRRSEEENRVIRKEVKPMNEIRTRKIVDRFYYNAERAFEKELKEEIESLCYGDPNVQEFLEKHDEIKALLKKFTERDGAIVNIHDVRKDVCYLRNLVTAETRKKIKEAETTSCDAHNECLEQKREILDVLSACETYDQEFRVLVAYGIINENGKMNNYEI